MFRCSSSFFYRQVSLTQVKGIVLSALQREHAAKNAKKTNQTTTSSSSSSSSSSQSILIDVREHHELKQLGTIPYSLHIPMNELSETLLDAANYGRDRLQAENDDNNNNNNNHNEDPAILTMNHDYQEDPVPFIGAPGEKQVVFFCAAGVRSAIAIDIAESCGYTNCCSHYAGGMKEWLADPLTQEDIKQFLAELERNK